VSLTTSTRATGGLPPISTFSFLICTFVGGSAPAPTVDSAIARTHQPTHVPENILTSVIENFGVSSQLPKRPFPTLAGSKLVLTRTSPALIRIYEVRESFAS
jgi:hypothetical protein